MKKCLTVLLSVILLVSSVGITAFSAGLPFKDVKQDQWFYEFVKRTYDDGVLKGTSSDTFAPNAPMTRAMFVQALANNSTTFRKTDAPQKFTDVSPRAWYYDAVQWAADLHIVSGTGSGKFNPNATITRADMCVILESYVLRCTSPSPFPHKEMGIDMNVFKDFSDIPEYAHSAVYWAYENKIVVGMGDHWFVPKATLTRAQAATVLTKIRKVNDPAYETYRETFSWNGKAVFTLDLPTSWKDECVFTYKDGVGEAYGEDIIASFASKKNYEYAGKDDLSGHEYYLGNLFSIYPVPSGDFREDPYHGIYLGELKQNGKSYVIAASFWTDVQAFADIENYVRMRRESEIMLEQSDSYNVCKRGLFVLRDQ